MLDPITMRTHIKGVNHPVGEKYSGLIAKYITGDIKKGLRPGPNKNQILHVSVFLLYIFVCGYKKLQKVKHQSRARDG
jgi:hypothetical protein